MANVFVLSTLNPYKKLLKLAVGKQECQTSCQSACKTKAAQLVTKFTDKNNRRITWRAFLLIIFLDSSRHSRRYKHRYAGAATKVIQKITLLKYNVN
ncbi:MAG: six-cysteine ranthipeptide SCIFF [Veillonella sp.]